MSCIDLFDYQIKAVEDAKNGCIICGGTGSGKSRTGLAYFYIKVCNGQMKINGKGKWKAPITPRDLYIITTPAKRDKLEWEEELLPFLLSPHTPDTNPGKIKVTIDSWNNIKKYDKVFGAFFLFDEQRVCGKGAWVKAFLKIARKNQFILLTATPGDVWSDYIPIFIANGFYRNRSDFNSQHVIFSPFTKYPKIDHYVNQGLLVRHRRDILIRMDAKRETTQNHFTCLVHYDKPLYLRVYRDRWDPYENMPIREPGKLGYLMRRVVNEDPSRAEKLLELVMRHKKTIIFYNYDYEVELLREVLGSVNGLIVKEYNGHNHDKLPSSERWSYLCQYASASEGWNCTTTDTIIFYSQNYSYRQTIQAAGRIDRANTNFKDLYYYHLKSNAPIDVAIERALSQKQNFNEKAFLGI